ncbi:MAG TPA: SsrA-binding protein, partial [Gallionellaceae bacterium]|nr:SsrA-binding protein [Gallionellaceae bacterium]
PDPVRTRKLLLHQREIDKLVGKVQRAGYTIMPLDMHYKAGRIKLDIGLAKGKKEHDKRATEREKDAKREAAMAMKKERR